MRSLLAFVVFLSLFSTPSALEAKKYSYYEEEAEKRKAAELLEGVYKYDELEIQRRMQESKEPKKFKGTQEKTYPINDEVSYEDSDLPVLKFMAAFWIVFLGWKLSRKLLNRRKTKRNKIQLEKVLKEKEELRRSILKSESL